MMNPFVIDPFVINPFVKALLIAFPIVDDKCRFAACSLGPRAILCPFLSAVTAAGTAGPNVMIKSFVLVRPRDNRFPLGFTITVEIFQLGLRVPLVTIINLTSCWTTLLFDAAAALSLKL